MHCRISPRKMCNPCGYTMKSVPGIIIFLIYDVKRSTKKMVWVPLKIEPLCSSKGSARPIGSGNWSFLPILLNIEYYSCKLYVYTVFSSPKHSYNGSKIIKLILTYQWWWL